MQGEKHFATFYAPAGRMAVSLERKRHLQIDAPVRGRRRIGLASKSIGLSEQRRTQIANWRRQIHIIENISCRSADRQIVALVSGRSVRTSWPSATTAAATWTSGATTKRAASSRAARASAATRSLDFFSKSKGFAHSQIQRKAPGPCGVIDRNQRRARRRIGIEATELGIFHCGGSRRTRSK